MLNIGSAYENRDDKGKLTSLTGYFMGGRVVIFPNKHKKSDNHPDYKLCVSRAKFEGDDNVPAPLVELAALYKNKTKAGDTFLKGYAGNSSILVLKNPNKEADNHPDYNILIVEKND
ncbi:MAG: hypothetical protein ACFFKA_08925 [Candidatus Thorarchaeota archaeon]